VIKAITVARACSTSAVFDRLNAFFSVLGFEPGKGWDDDRSRGASFLAPLGNIEFIDGMMPAPDCDLFIEVTAIEDVRRIAADWLKERGSKPTDIKPTDWKSLMFFAEPVPGIKFAFWQYADPQPGRAAAIHGDLLATGMRFGIIAARWNAVITDRLLDGALDALLRSGAEKQNITVVRVPGSFEIPSAARTLAAAHKVDAIIALGCLIRGETDHYEAIYNEVSRGLGQSQQETGIPHAFGVLTCENLQQALDRAGLKSGNKGFEAAITAIEMASLTRKINANGGTA
jgi:6,7-dimethyl-8-ribityllumazine synthase